MARIKRELVVEREKFVTEAFTADPKLTVKDVNNQLKAKYGRAMGLARLFTLRKQVLTPTTEE